jgi:ribose transport system permease protein
MTITRARRLPQQVGWRRNRRMWINTLVPATALAVMMVYFSSVSPSFLTLANLNVMSGQVGPLLIASLGATFVIVMGSIDLSVGSIALLTGAVVAKLLATGNVSLWLVIPAALLVGAGCGLANGAVFAYGRVPSFITTLGSLSIFSGAGLILINGSPLPFNAPTFSALAIGHLVPQMQNAALWALGAWLMTLMAGSRTRFGLYMYAIGGGEPVAQLSGIKVNRYKAYAFVLSGVTAALSGMLSVAALSSGGPTLGSTLLLDTLAAIVVGGTALSGGVGGVHRTLLGVCIITVLSSGLNQLGVGQFMQNIIKGAVIIIAATLTMIPERRLVVK